MNGQRASQSRFGFIDLCTVRGGNQDSWRNEAKAQEFVKSSTCGKRSRACATTPKGAINTAALTFCCHASHVRTNQIDQPKSGTQHARGSGFGRQSASPSCSTMSSAARPSLSRDTGGPSPGSCPRRTFGRRKLTRRSKQSRRCANEPERSRGTNCCRRGTRARNTDVVCPQSVRRRVLGLRGRRPPHRNLGAGPPPKRSGASPKPVGGSRCAIRSASMSGADGWPRPIPPPSCAAFPGWG